MRSGMASMACMLQMVNKIQPSEEYHPEVAGHLKAAQCKETIAYLAWKKSKDKEIVSFDWISIKNNPNCAVVLTTKTS